MGFILVVEDDSSVREMMKLSLEMYGYEAKTVADCNEASLEMKKARPNLIILDYMLESGTSESIIELAKEMEPATPIIMCSAWNKIEDIAKSKGIPWVLKKPFELEALGDMLKQILPGAFVSHKAS